MDEDTVTDVLSFPAGAPLPGPDPIQQSAGEIVVCIPVCEDSARKRNVSLSDEIARMLIHGALHVLGHDHATAAERRRMKPPERKYMAWVRRRRLQVIVSPAESRGRGPRRAGRSKK
jgi:probable rRNA maturation factor